MLSLINNRAFVVGWGAELLQAAFLIADDIMDESATRRGKTCWYCVKSVQFKFGLLIIGWHDER
jgi:geranylgeranyl pyrophosphate synthase